MHKDSERTQIIGTVGGRCCRWDSLGSNDPLSVYGFGLTQDETLSRTLEVIEVYRVPHSQCVYKPGEPVSPFPEWANSVVMNDLCALGVCTAEYCRDACNGDSGGFMVRNNTVFGIVSRGSPECGHGPLPASGRVERVPGIYVDLSNQISFIEGVTGLALLQNQPSSSPSSPSSPLSPSTGNSNPVRGGDSGQTNAAQRHAITPVPLTLISFLIVLHR